jgi:hypothetical protein
MFTANCTNTVNIPSIVCTVQKNDSFLYLSLLKPNTKFCQLLKNNKSIKYVSNRNKWMSNSVVPKSPSTQPQRGTSYFLTASTPVTHAQTHVHAHTHTLSHKHAHTHKHARMHQHIHTRTCTNTLICMDMFQPIQEHSLLYKPATPTLQNSALCTHCVPLHILTKNSNYFLKQDYLVGLCNGHPICFP